MYKFRQITLLRSFCTNEIVLGLPVPVCQNEVGGGEPLSRIFQVAFIGPTISVHGQRRYIMIRHDLQQGAFTKFLRYAKQHELKSYRPTSNTIS